MVMEGSQAKNPASEESETDHLEDHRRRLGHEQSTDHREQQVQVHEQAQRAQSGADRERAGVTHDDARGRGVPPEKAEKRADESNGDETQIERGVERSEERREGK